MSFDLRNPRAQVRRPRRFWATLTAGLTLLSTAGCGLLGGDEVANISSSVPTAAAEDMEQLMEDTTDYQKAVLVEGVERSEYESAAIDAKACMSDAGLHVEVVFGDPIITISTADHEQSVGGATIGAPSPVMVDCYNEYLNAVEAAYLVADAPTQEELAGELDLFYDCLRGKGYPIPENPLEDPDTSEIVDAADYDDHLDCWAAAGVGS